MPAKGQRDVDYVEYVEKKLLPDLHRLQGSGLDYLSFWIVGIAIVSFGDFFDCHGLWKPGHCKKRFKVALDKLFLPISEKYPKYYSGQEDDDYCLYRCLNNMAHAGMPSGQMRFRTRAEAKEEGSRHLCKGPGEELTLVVEDFVDDLEKAWQTLKDMSARGETSKKVTETFVSIRDE